MITFLLIIGLLSGLCGFGFLVAVGISFSLLASRGAGAAMFWLDLLTFGGWSLARGLRCHWFSRPDLRMLAWSGLSLSVAAAVLLASSAHFGG